MKKKGLIVLFVVFFFSVASALPPDPEINNAEAYKIDPNNGSKINIVGAGRDQNLFPGDTFYVEFDVNNIGGPLALANAYLEVSTSNQEPYCDPVTGDLGFTAPTSYKELPLEILEDKNRHYLFEFNALPAGTTYPSTEREDQTSITIRLELQDNDWSSRRYQNYSVWFENTGTENCMDWRNCWPWSGEAVCMNDLDCDDGLPYTADSCSSPGTCHSLCKHQATFKCNNSTYSNENEFHLKFNYSNDALEEFTLKKMDFQCEICYSAGPGCSWGGCYTGYRECTSPQNVIDSVNVYRDAATSSERADFNILVQKGNELNYSRSFGPPNDPSDILISQGEDLNIDVNAAFQDNGGHYFCTAFVTLQPTSGGSDIVLGGEGYHGQCGVLDRLQVVGDDAVVKEVYPESWYIPFRPSMDYNIFVKIKNMGTTDFDGLNPLYIDLNLFDDLFQDFASATFKTGTNPGDLYPLTQYGTQDDENTYKLSIQIPVEKYRAFLASGRTEVKVYKFLSDGSKYYFDTEVLNLNLGRLIQVFCPKSNWANCVNPADPVCPQPSECPDPTSGEVVYENECIIDELPANHTCDYNLMVLNPMPNPGEFSFGVTAASSPSFKMSILGDNPVLLPASTETEYGKGFDNMFHLDTSKMPAAGFDDVDVNMSWVDNPDIGDDLDLTIVVGGVDVGIKEMRLVPSKGVYKVGDDVNAEIVVKNYGAAKQQNVEVITTTDIDPALAVVCTFAELNAGAESTCIVELPPFTAPGDYNVTSMVTPLPMEFFIENNRARVFLVVGASAASVDEIPLPAVLIVLAFAVFLLVKKR